MLILLMLMILLILLLLLFRAGDVAPVPRALAAPMICCLIGDAAAVSRIRVEPKLIGFSCSLLWKLSAVLSISSRAGDAVGVGGGGSDSIMLM